MGMSRARAAALYVAVLIAGCMPNVRPAVTLSIARGDAPGDATVTIDEEYIGPLAFVAAHGVRLPLGEHRISIEKPGYFPMDVLVESDREPIHLIVHLEKIPE